MFKSVIAAGAVSAIKFHSDTWQLRSVKDHKTDSDIQIGFANEATAKAEADAQNKAETVGYELGDYAFVQTGYEFVETPNGGLYLQTQEDTHPVWGLRSVNWHAGDQKRIRGFADNQTGNANTEHKFKAETQSYSPATWGNVFG